MADGSHQKVLTVEEDTVDIRILALQCAAATYQSAQGLDEARTRQILARAKLFEAYLKGD